MTTPITKASDTANGAKNAVVKQNNSVYQFITQQKAAKKSREMYAESSTVVSDLLNSYAWDTALLFEQLFDDRSEAEQKTKYSRVTAQMINTEYANFGNSNDKICNIYDMAGNIREWSTEACENLENAGTARGGYHLNNYTASYRKYNSADTVGALGFRPILYVKGNSKKSELTGENVTEKTVTLYNHNTGSTTSPTITKVDEWTEKYWTISEDADASQTIANGGNITGITENKTYYARYDRTIEIKYDLNGITGSVPSSVTGTVKFNAAGNAIPVKATMPAKYQRAEYVFEGWSEDKDINVILYNPGDEVEFTSSITLYASWREITYVLTDGVEFKDLIPKDTTQIIFTTATKPSDAEIIDVDDDGDNGVIAWQDGTKMYVSTQKVGQKVIGNWDSSYMFANDGIVQDETITVTGNTLKVTNIDFDTDYSTFATYNGKIDLKHYINEESKNDDEEEYNEIPKGYRFPLGTK